VNFKQLTIFSLVSMAFATDRQLMYPGPVDESAPPPHYKRGVTLGYSVKRCDVGGVADVIEEGRSAEYNIDYLKLRVVTAQYGCTNGQELIVHKKSMSNPEYPETMKYEFYPTNLSRIVFNVTSNEYVRFPSSLFLNERDIWLQRDLEIENKTSYYDFIYSTRTWWYLDYQSGEPYAFWTNAVQFIRLEPNWTNYYELVRSGASSTSNRVKEDSFIDMGNLIWRATDDQLQMMLDDPLLPAIYRDLVECQIEVRFYKKNPHLVPPLEEEK